MIEPDEMRQEPVSHNNYHPLDTCTKSAYGVHEWAQSKHKGWKMSSSLIHTIQTYGHEKTFIIDFFWNYTSRKEISSIRHSIQALDSVKTFMIEFDQLRAVGEWSSLWSIQYRYFLIEGHSWLSSLIQEKRGNYLRSHPFNLSTRSSQGIHDRVQWTETRKKGNLHCHPSDKGTCPTAGIRTWFQSNEKSNRAISSVIHPIKEFCHKRTFMIESDQMRRLKEWFSVPSIPYKHSILELHSWLSSIKWEEGLSNFAWYRFYTCICSLAGVHDWVQWLRRAK